ncbi:LolA family protein [Halostella salina]|uniref:LolA family protein n=1 Tax=Halostella salina TaxID=1547897 RepID=UPI0013CE6BCB|nr:outer membrane lipoprotein carrier protein LolA [Halostella salina]
MPLTESPLRRAVVGVFAVFIIAAGLFAAFGGDTGASEPAPIGENASEQYAAIDGISATVTTEFEGPNSSSRTVMAVKERPDSQYLYQRTIEGPGNRTSIYANGSTMWLYDHDAGTATRQELPDTLGNGTSTGERVEDIFARINDKRGVSDVEDPNPGVSPLPVVSGPATTEPPVGEPSRNATEYDVTYLGTDTVDGRETHVVMLNGTLSGGNSSLLTNVTQKLWIDAERYYPLKYDQRYWIDGEQYRVRMTYSNVTFDPGLTDATFEFEPPENVTVERQTLPETTTYESRTALAAAAEMSVPEPRPPSGFEPDTFRRTSGEIRSVEVAYANATAEVSVTKSNRTGIVEITEENRAVADGRPVSYDELGGLNFAAWECGGHRYSVYGENVSKSTLLDVVATVECGESGDQERIDREYAMKTTPSSWSSLTSRVKPGR